MLRTAPERRTTRDGSFGIEFVCERQRVDAREESCGVPLEHTDNDSDRFGAGGTGQFF